MALTSDPLPEKIAAVLKENFEADTIIDLSASGVRDNLHVLVVSRALDQKTEKQKQEYLWSLLDDAVKKAELSEDDLGRISLVLPVSVEELKR